IRRAAITGAGSGYSVVELAQSPHAAQAIEFELPRKELCLPPHSRFKIANKAKLVEPVLRPLDRIHTGRQIQRGTHGANAAQFARGCRSQFPCHLQNQIAPHRITREKNPLQPVAFDELEENYSEISP